MADSKIIKGQAWIDGISLVQEQIKITAGVSAVTETVVLVEDIWEDLTSASGLYQQGKPGYFYWEYQMTSIDDDSTEVTIKYECPRPVYGLFKEPYDPESVEGDYAKYWVSKIKEASENYEKAYAIQRKEILLKGTEYFDPVHEDIKTVDDMTVMNTDLGDITNLLGMF